MRAVLAGSPLHGTSLAAPDKIQHAMSLISNVGTFAEKTMSLVGLANPFLWVAGKLVEVIVSVTGALAQRRRSSTRSPRWCQGSRDNRP